MENIKIIIASDSIGETAELVARACISQFNPKECKHEFLRYPISRQKRTLMKLFK